MSEELNKDLFEILQSQRIDGEEPIKKKLGRPPKIKPPLPPVPETKETKEQKERKKIKYSIEDESLLEKLANELLTRIKESKDADAIKITSTIVELLGLRDKYIRENMSEEDKKLEIIWKPLNETFEGEEGEEDKS
jgi:hypothetical protein